MRPVISLVEDKSVLFTMVNAPIMEFLFSKLWHRLPAWETPRNLRVLHCREDKLEK